MKRLKELFVLFLMFGLPVLVCLVLDWLIATSNLPYWFKFALLSK